MSYEDFCKENKLIFSSQRSYAEYQRYTENCDIENRPYYDDIYREAKKIKSKLPKKK